MSEGTTPSVLHRFDLTGRVAVVTGASRGIGAAIAAGLMQAGASVYGLSRSGSAPPAVTSLACDLENLSAISSAFEEIGRRSGGVDILVNAAGITLAGADRTAVSEVERLRRTLAVDLVAPYACILAGRPLMRVRGNGSVVNITSINSVLGFPDNPGYVAAKAALAGLTRALAVDLAVDGMRINAVAPGYIRTAMTEASYADPARHEARSRQTILGRWGMPDDVVGAVVFLASDASAYITGQEIFVDGGWSVNGLPRSPSEQSR